MLLLIAIEKSIAQISDIASKDSNFSINQFMTDATTATNSTINNAYNYSQFNSSLITMENKIGNKGISITIDSLLQQILKTGKTDKATALQLFDKLPPVDTDFMLGIWSGNSLYTNHQLDGLLEVCGWYGKYFMSTEDVHPLVMKGRRNTKLWSLNPKNIPLNVHFPKSKALGFFMKLLKPFLQTKKSKARLRMVEYRGKLTATMIYDNKAINDHFVKIDENTVLGCMDRKQDGSPFFWIMKRNKIENYSLKIKHS